MGSQVTKSFKRPTKTSTFTLPLDPNDASKVAPFQNRLTDAQKAVEDATEASAPADRLAKLQKAVDDAQAAYNAELAKYETITFTIQALSGARQQILQSEHPATDEQIEAAKKTDPDEDPPDFNMDTYPPALLAVSTIKVEWSDGTSANKLTEAQANDFYSTSSSGDQRFIMSMIGMLNNIPSLVGEVGKGSAGIPASVP